MIWCENKKCSNQMDDTHCCFLDAHLDKDGKCKEYKEMTKFEKALKESMEENKEILEALA